MNGLAADPGSADQAAGSPSPAVPGLLRRMACFTYEGVLLFGVLMFAGFVYSALTEMRQALHGKLGLQIFLFGVLGLYFTGFWSRGGQTVAMRAWHIRLVDGAGQPVSRARAFSRYLLAWLWFIPSLIVASWSGLGDTQSILGCMAVGVLAYAALSWLLPQGQFWHDVVCGTRLVDSRPASSARTGRS